jgi:thiamine pyrophosphokinase
VCADGAANRLRRGNEERKASSSSSSSAPRVELIPDAVYGDLDSLDSRTIPELRAKGVQVERNPCQDTNDLQKCVEMICRGENDDGGNKAADHRVDVDVDASHADYAATADLTHIIVAGALGGRLDHEMGNLNVAMQWCNRRSLVLLGAHSMALVLPTGVHEIIPDLRLETSTCGLIPLGNTCQSVTTTGLEYDLAEHTLEFGDLVSSSNAVRAGCTRVTVETSHPLLWTTSLSWEHYLAQH